MYKRQPLNQNIKWRTNEDLILFLFNFNTRVKKIIWEGLRALDIYDQNAKQIEKQAEQTSKSIYEYHAEHPTTGTAEFIRKLSTYDNLSLHLSLSLSLSLFILFLPLAPRFVQMNPIVPSGKKPLQWQRKIN